MDGFCTQRHVGELRTCVCWLVGWLADRFSKKTKRKLARVSKRVLLLFLGLAVGVDAVSAGN